MGLTINNVNSQDKGVYTCVARAKCEKGIEISTDTDSATLTVIESTKIASGPSDTQKDVGGTVVMDCKVSWDSRYDLNIEWRHEGDHLNADERMFNIILYSFAKFVIFFTFLFLLM